MEGPERALVVLLSMHRSGSSLTANILRELGMSLGPFQLLGALPSNPRGHFEAIPFLKLNRKLHDWAFGFEDDQPTSRELHARFVETQGAWPTDRTIPADWLDEGERLVRALVESGSPCGFKDPRTVLTWPFWRRVFERIEDLRVVPAVLLRSPHEIAMSLCARADGNVSYWDALDLVEVHLTRLKAIVDDHQGTARATRFATPHYRADLRDLAETCGLSWDDARVDRVYDHSAVHELPAAVPHPAQALYEALAGGDCLALDAEENSRRLAGDARRAEALTHDRLTELRERLAERDALLQQAETRLAEVQHHGAAIEAELTRTREAHERAEAELVQTREACELLETELLQTREAYEHVEAELIQTREAHELASECLAESERNLIQMMDRLVSMHERLASSEAELRLETGERGHRADAGLAEAPRQSPGIRERLREGPKRLAEFQALVTLKVEQLGMALEREERLGFEVAALRGRLRRIESHALIGPALRGRRRVKRFWLKLRERGDDGAERSARVDRPH